MLQPFRKLAKFSSSPFGAKMVLIFWLVAIVLLSVLLPSAKDYAGTSTEGSVRGDSLSEIAAQVNAMEFSSDDDGIPALLVFHNENALNEEERGKISELSEWLASDDKPAYVVSALPYHHFPEEIQNQMYSEDETTMLFHVSLEQGLEASEANETLEQIRAEVVSIGLTDLQLEITGPAAIAADTTALFQNADFVLMLATIVLIFVILIVIYRSPLLAIMPLLIAGMVYGVVDRLLGLAGKNDWFAVDSSAFSIMLVLLFAIITDYSLFVFSRYKEELQKQESKYESMKEAIHHVSEPIFLSGGTVLLAMLTLFVTVFEPYNHFAPVFSLAVVVILLAGLTLIPSIFALLGRKAFWPVIPKVKEENKKQSKYWLKVSEIVTKKAGLITSVFLLLLAVAAFNTTTINFSFNLMKSFPEDISSRQGFELLADHFPEGQLAPVSVILQSDEQIDLDETFYKQVNSLRDELEKVKGVSTVSPKITEEMINGEANLPRNFLAEEETAIKLELILDGNPFELEALETIQTLRELEGTLLESHQFPTNKFSLHYAGQTAEQLDVKEMNERDMIFLFSSVILLLTVILIFQFKSILLPLIMMATILLTYVASLGISWWIFENLLGYEAISYRIPVYTFIFMVALGIDYSIILISRIREQASNLPWKEAIQQGVVKTGSVIASAGLILAATC
ncbi:membrane protein [Alkalihalobacillus alcalophilus ATCC 27647 = CGMCC 1.3604]|uniref:Membrane protein n=1 Tax=Alkalihalobacillus alcalophilus ATCC 27647 = CGMCC 1.3604 TaxID=1218173 RepID=J8TSD2_ALKAL|nr:MMPL family transporter [Alkalihalobacillus alcalophilus]AFV25786.1 multidrug/solvent efflux transporter [Alkalihalobacillus alcalophilus ATCC 27647 = CGMCC 1.3604]MED1561745.1 MMPL family transporter [Alkalihalobacillus alcalophilus]THG91894.1 membrane protein [Alkalihalobacillus alcalophilus ATCC 27647 = CGMCC 1.3604]